MIRIFKFVGMSDVRTFKGTAGNGTPTDVEAMTIRLTDGINELVGDCYRDMVKRVRSIKPESGDLVTVKLSCSVKERQTATGTFFSNAIVIEELNIMMRETKTF